MGCSPVFWNLRQNKRLSADMPLYVRLVASDCPLIATHQKPVFIHPQTCRFAYRHNCFGHQVTTTNLNRRVTTANPAGFKLFGSALVERTATLNTGIHMHIVGGHVAILIHTPRTHKPHYPTTTSCSVWYVRLSNTVLVSVVRLYLRFMTVYVEVFFTTSNALLTNRNRFNTWDGPAPQTHTKAALKLSFMEGGAASSPQQWTHKALGSPTQSTSAGSIPGTDRLPKRMPQHTFQCRSSTFQGCFPQPTCCVTHKQRYLTSTRTAAGSSIYDDRKVSFGVPVASCRLLASGIVGMLRL